MNKKLTLLKAGFIYFTTSLLLIACNSKDKPADEPAANGPATTLPVDMVVVKEENLDQQELIVGSMRPYRDVAIISEISQKITRIAFTEGGTVSKGQLLYQLNDADLKARIKGLNAELQLARLNEQRSGRLLKSETVNQQEYDEGFMKLQSLQAQQELLQVELNKTMIRAPFSGKIGLSKVDLGAFVSPGMELVSIQDNSSIKLNFSVPEKYIAQVKNGRKVSFTTQLSDKKYTATIRATEADVSAQSRSLMVQAIAENPGGIFRAGLSANILFSTMSTDSKGIRLPTEALIPGAEGYSVFVVKNGIAKSVPVKIGNRSETEAIISSGLHNGDSVVVSNILRTADGIPVQPAAFK